ncbi:MAG TPA: OsmC family protein [Acidimicrobiales bacterium]
MTSVRHIARAVGSTSTSSLPYRVELRAGNHELIADEQSVGGGSDAGPSPFGLLLSGLAACTSMTVRMYADRKGWTIDAIEVDVRYDVDDDGEASIARMITFPADLPVEQRDRLADIAERTPVTLAIRNGVPITTTLRSADDA